MTAVLPERQAPDMFAAALELLLPKPKPPRRWASPLDMACDLDPTMVRTPALELINRKLVALADAPNSGITRLAVQMSPQEGKSTLCSYWNPLWLLVDGPDRRIMIISYAMGKALDWGQAIKNAVEQWNGEDGMVDLGLRLRADSRASGKWNLEGHRGGVVVAGVNSGISGKPADYIVVDDPLKNLEEAQSEAYRGRLMRTYRGAIIPRMGPHTRTCWIQTLWHESEPILEILQHEVGSWDQVRIPAIADEPDDPLGREVGEPMISARGDRDFDRIRRDVGAYVFSALYQQRPSPAEGNLFKRLWFRYWTPAPQQGFGDRVDLGGRVFDLRDCWRVGSVDLAASKKSSADWTVALAVALTSDGDIVVLDMVRAHLGETEHFSAVRPLAERWKLDTTFVEKSFHNSALAAMAGREGISLTPVTADTDKITRALPASVKASNGRVWLPAGAWWLDVWRHEFAGFPTGSHDDMVDALSQVVRVAVTRWNPGPPKPPAQPPADEIDFMSQPL